MESDDETQNWSLNADSVQAALMFINQRGTKGVTTVQLVRWDETHGKKLFTWNDEKAAHDHRLNQARLFLNSFHGVFRRMRVRKFMKVPEGELTGRETGAYLDTKIISEDEKMRAWAIGDLTRRIVKMTSELRFWKLTQEERTTILTQLEVALQGNESAA